MDDYCTFTFNGTGGGTYYIPCDRAGDLNEKGIVTVGNSFYGYSAIYGSNYSERVQFRTTALPTYYSSGSSYNAVVIGDLTGGEFNDRAIFYRRYSELNFEVILVILLLISLLVNFFLRGHR